MADDQTPDENDLKKPTKLPLILAIVACMAGIGGGFFAVFSGLILSNDSPEQSENEKASMEDIADIAFVEIDPITVTLRPGSSSKHLSFRSQLEVPKIYREDVEHLLPRIIDVMNGYLSALETEDFENPAIIIRLRSQLLRRIQVVTGLDRVNDLLVMEFVLN
jgi:flagellar FliL protein